MHMFFQKLYIQNHDVYKFLRLVHSLATKPMILKQSLVLGLTEHLYGVLEDED
ncbi:Uncharacterised protein [Escherichia coli]|nr:Uncharacterised protein [Escherichia coli]